MQTMPFDEELSVALSAAEEAGRLIREQYDRFVPIPDAPSDITTDADRASQELILQAIRRKFPTDALAAEENTPSLEGMHHSGPRLWIVDPIDGTRGFAVKNGEFSVMIAFVERGQIRVGVVLEPATWLVTYATHGGGCWRYREPGGAKSRCRVGAARELTGCTLTQSRSRTARESPVVKKIQPAKIVETFSSGVKLARVAGGEADIFANIYAEFHDWDVCAGHILVEEAGGKVTTLAGAPMQYGNEGNKQRQGMIATNGLIHDAAVAALGA
jgi:3'(2'), 5'-bisphosphate nucleotidase